MGASLTLLIHPCSIKLQESVNSRLTLVRRFPTMREELMRTKMYRSREVCGRHSTRSMCYRWRRSVRVEFLQILSRKKLSMGRLTRLNSVIAVSSERLLSFLISVNDANIT